MESREQKWIVESQRELRIQTELRSQNQLKTEPDNRNGITQIIKTAKSEALRHCSVAGQL